MPNKGIHGDQVNDRKGRKFKSDPDQKRGRNQRNLDPYVMDEGRPEPAICGRCHAIFKNKRWYFEENEFNHFRRTREAAETVCPACQKVTQSYPEGIVTLRGDYLWHHEEEIRNILKKEENKAMAKNPLERIIRMEREGDDLVIETTEEKLAEHLGRALNKAHQGELKIDWSNEHSLCRVIWERSA